MARKEDKYRPYRVDWFNIEEMKENDLALVRSSIVRAVTSAQASGLVMFEDYGIHADKRVIVRAYRFYKNLVHKKDVFKPVEELFTVNKALKVMERIETYRTIPKRKLDRTSGVTGYEAVINSTLPRVEKQLLSTDSTGHVTRFSDSSLYDEVCVNCGATDNGDKLNQRCPTPAAPTSGPESPATQAVVADLRGMIAHDAHEQLMDTFVPTPGSIPEGKNFPKNDQPVQPSVEVTCAANADEVTTAEFGLLRSTSTAPEFGDTISAAVADESPTVDPRFPNALPSTEKRSNPIAIWMAILFLVALGWFLTYIFHH